MIDNLIYAASTIIMGIWFAVMWLAIVGTVAATAYWIYTLIA
jgi:hypothetical protein